MAFVYFSEGDEPIPIDGDDPAHITWIYEKAMERASQYSIQGVTYRLTQVFHNNVGVSEYVAIISKKSPLIA